MKSSFINLKNYDCISKYYTHIADAAANKLNPAARRNTAPCNVFIVAVYTMLSNMLAIKPVAICSNVIQANRLPKIQSEYISNNGMC